MAQTKEYLGGWGLEGAHVIQQNKKEVIARTKSRGGEFGPNPPSTSLPASIRIESDVPQASVPIMGDVPFVNPVLTPVEALADRTVNNAPNNVSIANDLTDRSTPATTAGINGVERAINQAVMGGKPETQNVIARDSKITITNDQPPTPDHP